MKRAWILCCLFSLLLTGCGTAAQEEEVESKIIITITEPPTEETAAPTEPPIVTAAPETITETVPTECDTEAPASSEIQTSGEGTGSDVPVTNISEGYAALMGEWAYGENYWMCFYEENVMTVRLEYTEVMSIKNGMLLMTDMSCPVTVSGSLLTAVYEGETVLSMTAENNEDAGAFSGRYRLGDCAVRDTLFSADSADSCYIRLEGDRLYAEMDASYELYGDGTVLRMNQNGNDVYLHCEVDGDTLRMTDSDGATDVLTRSGS